MTTRIEEVPARSLALRIDLGRWLPSLVMAGYGIFILSLFLRGLLTMYINPTYIWPTTAAGVALLVFAGARLFWRSGASDAECEDGCCTPSAPRLWPYIFLSIPLLLAILLPPRTLGAFSARQRGLQVAGLTTMTGATTLKRVSLSVNTQTFSLQDWAGALAADPNPKDFNGKPVSITGMVLHDSSSTPPGYIMVIRYQVTCCIADARAEGLIVRDTSRGALKDSQWVRVVGTMTNAEDAGQKVPVVQPTTLVPTKAGNPYMY